jgi:hypothetical protein
MQQATSKLLTVSLSPKVENSPNKHLLIPVACKLFGCKADLRWIATLTVCDTLQEIAQYHTKANNILKKRKIYCYCLAHPLNLSSHSGVAEDTDLLWCDVLSSYVKCPPCWVFFAPSFQTLTAIPWAEEVKCRDSWNFSHHSTTDTSITAHWSRPHKGHFVRYSFMLWNKSNSLKQFTQDLQVAYIYGCLLFVYVWNELYPYVWLYLEVE